MKTDKYVKMYNEALDFHRPKFDEYAEASAYYEVSQEVNTGYTTKPWVYQINVPFATDAINLRVASLQASDYRGELEPLSPEDVDNVKALNDAYKWAWDDMSMNRIIDDAILKSAVMGEAFTHTIFNTEKIFGGKGRKNQGKMKTYFLDAASVHIDPKGLSLSTADYVCITERITRDAIKIKYPEFTLSDEQIDTNVDPSARGEIYWGQNYTPEDVQDIFTKVTIYEKVDDGIEKTVLVNDEIAEKTERLDIKSFPVNQLIWQKKVKSPYGTSLMSMLLPLQKVLNEIESANANANMQYSSPSYVISELSGIDPEEFARSAGAPAVVYTVSSQIDIDRAVRPLIQNRGIDQGLVETKRELEASIYKLAGVTDEFKGSLGTAGNTSTGADAAISRASVIEEMFLANIASFIEDLSRTIVEFISIGYAGETIYPRGQQDVSGNWEFNQYEIPEDAEEVEYNFYIELNIRSKYSKEKQYQKLMDLWQMERQYGDQEELRTISTLDIMKTLNLPQLDVILARFEESAKMDAESRADMLTELVVLSMELGIDGQMLNEVMVEIIEGRIESPIVEEFLAMIDEMAMAQEEELLAAEQRNLEEEENTIASEAPESVDEGVNF